MPTREEITNTYKRMHDELSNSYYNKTSGLTKEEFDILHGNIWTDMDEELKAASDYVIPPPPEPPRSTHISVLEAVDPAKARPAKIKRVWEGRDYFYDCFVTQTVKDQFVAGDVAVGDYVIVHFDDIGEQIVTAKAYKSWQ